MAEEPRVRFTCPNCGKRLSANKAALGLTIKCPNRECNAKVTAPNSLVPSENQSMSKPSIAKKAATPVGFSKAFLLMFSLLTIVLTFNYVIKSINDMGGLFPARQPDNIPEASNFQHENVITPETAKIDESSKKTDLQSNRIPKIDDKNNLSDVDKLFLKLATERYLSNSNAILHKSLHALNGPLAKVAANEKNPSIKKAAQLLLVREFLLRAKEENENYNLLVMDEIVAAYFLVAVDGAIAGLGKDLVPSFSEFRKGPGRAFDEFGDRLRSQKIRFFYLTICLELVDTQLALLFNDYLKTKMPSDQNPDCESLVINKTKNLVAFLHATELEDAEFDGIPSIPVELTEEWPKKYTGGFKGVQKLEDGTYFSLYRNRCAYGGSIFKIEYRGTKSLTNISIVHMMSTTGVSVELGEGEKQILQFNQASGYGSHNYSVEEEFKLHKIMNSMPGGGIVFVSQLNPGDVLHIPVQSAGKEFEDGYKIKVFSDQGSSNIISYR